MLQMHLYLFILLHTFVYVYSEIKKDGTTPNESAIVANPHFCNTEDDYSAESQKLLEECNELAEDYRYDEGLACYTKAIERNPSEAAFYYGQRGQFFSEMGYFKEALSDYKIALSLRTDAQRRGKYSLDYSGLAELGKRLCRAETLDEAMWCLDESIKSNPKEASYFRLRGDCFLKMQNWNSAISDYRSIMQMDSLSKADHVHLSTALFESGRFTEAVNEIMDSDDSDIANLGKKFMIYSGDLEKAIRCFTEAIRKNPGNAEYYRLRARCLIDKKDREGAISDMRIALKILPTDVQLRYLLIDTLFRSKQIDEAIKETLVLSDGELIQLGMAQPAKSELTPLLFTEAIKRNPSEESYYRLRGACYQRLNKLELATLDFQKCVNLNPNNQNNRIHLIQVLVDAGRQKEAETEITHLDLIDLLDLCLNFQDSEKLEMAIKCCTVGIETTVMTKENPEFWLSNLYKNRGFCYWKRENYEKAIRDYEKSLRTVYSIKIQIELCDLLVEAKKYDRALQALDYLQTEKSLDLCTLDSENIARIREKIMKNRENLISDRRT